MSEPLKIDRWIPMGEAARMVGLPTWQLRRRLRVVNAQSGGKLLKNFSRGTKRARWHVSAEALMHHLRTDHEQHDEDVGLLKIRISELEARLDAERRARLTFQAKAHAWFTGKRTNR